MTDVRGKIVFITGGASGLGKNLALTLASLGSTITLCDINEANLEKAAREIKERTGREAHTYVCDITDREKVYALAKTIEQEVGTVQILINNAGIVSGDHLLDIPDEKIERTFKVNALAPFWVTKAFLPGMLDKGEAHIVTIASAAGFLGCKKMTDYCSSKFAAVGFAESLRMELQHIAPHINTTLVCPFFIDTGMFDGAKTRFSFLLPILKESYVVSRIIRAIERNREELIMPNFVRILPFTRIFPTRMFDALANFFGVNAAMEDFKGRQAPKTTPNKAPQETKQPLAT